MPDNDRFKLLVIASVMAVLVSLFARVVIERPANNGGVTTESSAAVAGAKVEPTEPQLRVEPK
jgi:hypothetical protein